MNKSGKFYTIDSCCSLSYFIKIQKIVKQYCIKHKMKNKK